MQRQIVMAALEARDLTSSRRGLVAAGAEQGTGQAQLRLAARAGNMEAEAEAAMRVLRR
jgi:hypothetical protein